MVRLQILRTTMAPSQFDVQWFPAEIRRLILAIKKHESLYNPRHCEFGLRDAQLKSWKVVATLVGGNKTDLQCRDKWNCLRGTYRRHVRTEATNNVKRRSGWPWADMMSFVKKHIIDKEELAELCCTHNKSNTPPNEVKKIQSQNPAASNTTTTTTSSGLSFAGKIISGGIIFNTNRMGIGIVQPSQPNVGIKLVQPSQGNVGIGIVQPNKAKPNLVAIAQPNQTHVGVGFVQPNQTLAGLGLIRPNQPNIKLTTAQPNKNNVGITGMNSNTTGSAQNVITTMDSVQSADVDPIQVDLSKVKADPDGPDSPGTTEFVDISTIVKKEPMEENEIHIPQEFNFMSEDSTQESVQSDDHPNRESNKLMEVESIKLTKSKPSDNNSSPTVDDESDQRDSNQLFMQSILAHMRQLSPYDQSMFKMKVQQLLHDMMFPRESCLQKN